MKKWWNKIIEKIGDDIAMQIAESSVIKGNINEIYSRIADLQRMNRWLLRDLANSNDVWQKQKENLLERIIAVEERNKVLENEVLELKKYNQSVIEKDGAVCIDNPDIAEQASTTEDAFDTFLDSFDKAAGMLSGEVK